MQTAYVSPEMEIFRFESEDVIITSSCPNDTKTLNPDDDEIDG